MRIVRPNKKQSGFTLVELLIVAIILAILAAIIVPQFASTTVDAQEAALRSNLTGMRSAINLYRQQHGEFPSASASSGATCPASGTAGLGAADNPIALVDQLTRYSNAAGQTCSTSSTEFSFGPYLQDDDLPNNPVTTVGTVVIVTTGDLAMTASTVAGGWRYDNASGKFIADDTNEDSQGAEFASY